MDKVFESAQKYEMASGIKEQLDETYGEYMRMLEKIYSFNDKTIKYYLKTLKGREIVHNQETELEMSFLMELYSLYQRKDSIEIVMQALQDGKITKDEIVRLHRIVIKGSVDDDPKNYELRSDNEKWVGYFGTGGAKRVDYYPPDYHEIEQLLDLTLEYLNDDKKESILNHTLVKPFMVHGLLAYLQPFGNGNTRLARVLQHGKIWQLTNFELPEDKQLEYPAIYLSKNYFITRPDYRKFISGIANNQDWDTWMRYNLYSMDDQMRYLGENLSRLRNL